MSIGHWFVHRTCSAALGALVLGGVSSPLAARADEAPPYTPAALEEAALAQDPQIQADALAAERYAALLEQAGLRPNPELELEFEEFAGTGDLQGIEALATTLRYSVDLLPTEQRTTAQALLQIEAAMLGVETEARQRGIRLVVGEQLTAVLEARARFEVASRRVALARETQGVVDVRVEAGRAAPLEATRSRIDLEQAESNAYTMERELAAAVAALALLTGTPDLRGELLDGDLHATTAPPPLEELRTALNDHPDVRRLDLERDRREAAIAVERAAGMPGSSWSAGLSQFQETDEWALSAGMSWEWPRRNRNQGGIRAAELALEQLEPERATTLRDLNLQLDPAWHALDRAYQEVRRTETAVVPLAEEVLSLTQEAYRAGKVGLVEVLDAQETLIEVQESHLDALMRYHEAALALRALTGWNVLETTAGGSHP